MGRLLVISGVPASGKTTYCEWLAGQGWVFINHDRVTARAEDQTWWRLVTSRRSADFVQVVGSGDRDVVLEFGFPIALLPDVRQLKAAGAQHWWFEADHDVAREKFIARNDELTRAGKPHLAVDIRAFERYVSDIAAHRDEIRALFAARIIETLQRDGTRMRVEDVDRQVVAGSTWSGDAR